MDTLKPLIALLAIVNPIGVIPFFIHFTEGFTRPQRRRTVHTRTSPSAATRSTPATRSPSSRWRSRCSPDPATISTRVIYAQQARRWWEIATLVGYGVVIGLAVWFAFMPPGRIAKWLGKTGINVMTRLMGLLLAALAVEVMAEGLGQLFPGLLRAGR